MPEQLPKLRGNKRLHTSVTAEFRDLVAAAARRQKLSTQDYVLLALRDRLAGAEPTQEDRHKLIQMLQSALDSKKTPHHIRDGIHHFEQWLRCALGLPPPET